MKGVVLCGGNSTRMGSDKGLLKIEEETWAEFAARKLTAIGLPVAISINPQQVGTYETVFDKEVLVPDKKELPVQGPILGLLSIHLHAPEEDIFILACDMLEMTTPLLQALYTHHQQGNHEALVYSTAGKRQPLCAIYTIAGLKKIYNLLQEGRLQRFSMMHVLDCLNTNEIVVAEADLACFNNYNGPLEQ